MDQSNTPTIPTTGQRDPSACEADSRWGWTDARKAQFLEHLAQRGNVRAACALVGLSREAAYRLRRRDALFARAWAAALVLAREANAEVLADRAIDGIEEEVWYRGEVVGTRRRYDNRLLLAHMARLDALAGSDTASEDAERFDELVALAAGAAPPEELTDHGLPPSRERCIDYAEAIADEIAADLECEAAEGFEAPDEVQDAELLAAADRRQAGRKVALCWDAWVNEARTTVDRLLAEPLDPRALSSVRTVSTLSTSPLARAPYAGQPGVAPA